MISALCIGRGGSKGMPGKNVFPIGKMNYPMMAYPLIAARDCIDIDEVFFSSDDKLLKEIGVMWGAKIIDRPPELCTDEALGEDAFVHGYNWIDKYTFGHFGKIEFIVLLFANAPCINSKILTDMISLLRYSGADSCCTVSKYNMFSPYRMRCVNLQRGTVDNYLTQFELSESNCDRDSAGDFYIYDCSAAVVTPRCLEDIDYGFLPQKWLGRGVLPYIQEIPALDVDYEFQIGQVEYWLVRNGKA